MCLDPNCGLLDPRVPGLFLGNQMKIIIIEVVQSSTGSLLLNIIE